LGFCQGGVRICIDFFCSFLERKEPKELPAKEFLLESKGWFIKAKLETE
jgi:hypothetical protein